jgi:RimJ/RimL family protein N-acetyltransferase
MKMPSTAEALRSKPHSIRSSVIELTLFNKDDITPNYLSWLNDRELMQFSGQSRMLHTFQTSLDYLNSFKDSPHYFWAIRSVELSKTIGTMTAYVDSANQTADIGILIGESSARGCGFGKHAWGVAMDYLLRSTAIRKVTGGTVASNAAMVKVFLHWNMTLEGVRREQQLVGGTAVDVLEFGTMRRDWLDRHEQALMVVAE